MQAPQASPVALLSLTLLLAGLAGSGRPASAAETLQMMTGVQRIVTFARPVARIVIGEAGLVDASVQDERAVQLVALRPGRTTMAVFTTGSTQSTVYNLAVNDADARPAALAPGAAVKQALATRPDLRGVQVRSLGSQVLLSGTLADLETHENAMDIAKAFGGDAVVDQTRVSGDQMVAVEIRFAAIAATTINELGFNFQSLGRGFQGVSTAPNSIGSLATTGANLAVGSGLPIASAFNLLLSGSNAKGSVLGILSALSSAGLTQLLAQPTLVVRSGEHANFLAGGEVPIPVPQGGASAGAITITYHTYGVRLDVAPTVLSDRRISMVVSPEVSEIDNANAISIDGFTVPAFRKRSTSTTVELGDGESFIIAGLIYNNSSITESRVPFLGSLPILGAFFKISQNTRERQELIVIATPHLVRPLDAAKLPPLPGEEISRYNPGPGAMVLNAKSLNAALAGYGLMK